MKHIIDQLKEERSRLRADLAKVDAALARLEPEKPVKKEGEKKPGRKPRASTASPPTESPFTQEAAQ